MKADICFDDDDNTLYCDYGCCGLDDEYCCDDSTYWGVGSIAGTAVGLTFFIIFVVLIVICCRRRRLAHVYVRQHNAAGVTVVQSANVQHLNSVAANVDPVYPQYPASSQYPQQGYPPPAYPAGQAQPPPYSPK